MSLHPVGSELVDRIGPEEIQDIRHGVAPDSRGAILPRSIDGHAQYIINFRRDASEPERHDDWDDILIIQHGYGHVEFGRSIKGGTKYAEGEWRGGVLEGELTSLDVAPGVVVRIPARVPHVIRPLNSTPLVYLTVKEMAAIPR
jgi:mannose-6-phosphate isomerase-like protein (cupin superfamily)